MGSAQHGLMYSVQICPDVTESWKVASRKEGVFLFLILQLLWWLFPFLLSFLDLDPVISNVESSPRTVLSALPPTAPPPSLPLFSFWPRLLRALRSQQLDSCVQSETTYNSRRFKRETSA